ncbi:MAG TPA: SdrD B-like domain-containing protein [Thermoguttaceae bacterium]|nr:SdrD B-like domain-containing protein [Thermoguttaceae bacterium]
MTSVFKSRRKRQYRGSRSLGQAKWKRSQRLALEPLEDRRLLSLAGIVLQSAPIFYGGDTDTLAYDAASQSFDLDAEPVTFAPPFPPIFFTPPRDFQIHIKVDSDGKLIGGVPGADDLVLTGAIDVDIDGDSVVDHLSGTLLTGEVTEFGFNDVGTTDYYDFRFTLTGGAMQPYFAGSDIGVLTESWNSTFTGDFGVDFGGGAKGYIGPVEALVEAGIDIEKFVKSVESGGGEGLTPGYWKQSQHFDDWTDPYDPEDNYNDTFGVSDDPDLTLLGALERGGGEENALGRHAVAALLNAAHPGIDYAFTTAEIISMVQSAYATGEFEAIKDQFEAENELEADLSDAPSSGDDTSGSDYGVDADEPPGLVVEVGTEVEFTYVVTNPGDVPLANVVVTDDNGTLGDVSDDFAPTPVLEGERNVGDTNGNEVLEPGETWLFTHVSDPVTAGQHTNLATVTAMADDVEVSDDDPANWYGATEGSTIEGIVWEDTNDDGEIDSNEQAIQGVAVELTGTDYQGNPVHQVAVTDSDGVYMFLGVQPSNGDGYTIEESQPDGYDDGKDVLGTVNGVRTGDDSVNDTFSGVVIQAGRHGENYNFGELPTTAVEDFVHKGQTATIGYWQNKNGQNLIKSLNDGPDSTTLGNWLAETFPNMYGKGDDDTVVNPNDLTGMTNAEVASFYKAMFRSKKNNKKSKTDGPAKLDPQVMAVALAVYVTNSDLAGGAYAASYGFEVTTSGVGGSYFDVDAAVGAGTAETLFETGTPSVLSVIEILKMTDARSSNGNVFEDDGDGVIEADEALMRVLANELFTAINESGDIG